MLSDKAKPAAPLRSIGELTTPPGTFHALVRQVLRSYRDDSQTPRIDARQSRQRTPAFIQSGGRHYAGREAKTKAFPRPREANMVRTPPVDSLCSSSLCCDRPHNFAE